MKYLEILYNPVNKQILSVKIHGKMDTVVPNGCLLKTIPFYEGIHKNLNSKLFDGNNFIDNPNYVQNPKTDGERLIEYAKKQKWI